MHNLNWFFCAICYILPRCLSWPCCLAAGLLSRALLSWRCASRVVVCRACFAVSSVVLPVMGFCAVSLSCVLPCAFWPVACRAFYGLLSRSVLYRRPGIRRYMPACDVGPGNVRESDKQTACMPVFRSAKRYENIGMAFSRPE